MFFRLNIPEFVMIFFGLFVQKETTNIKVYSAAQLKFSIIPDTNS